MTFLYIVIGLILIFAFINGVHDSANSVATAVTTHVLNPLSAVALAAIFNFLGFFIFPLNIAETMEKGIITPEIVSLSLIASAVIAGTTWNLFTWWLGLPSSSSHTLIGGLVGAALASSGFGSVVWAGVIKIIMFIIIAPVLGMVSSFIISSIIQLIVKNSPPTELDKYFRRLQLISSSAYSLGHGGNDALKSVGMIWLALIAANEVTKDTPINMWIILSCYLAIALGTLFGGWRIIKTMGQRITKLNSFEGFSAETAGAMTLFGTIHFGIPISTTHTITGSIIGVGASHRISAVRWGVTSKILWAWILTIPVSALIGAGIYYLLQIIV